MDKLYKLGPPPEFPKEWAEWLSEKDKLGLDFPNLPYIIDGDVKITQTATILRYLGKKYQLVGRTAQEKIRINLVEQTLLDFRQEEVECFYSPTFDEAVKQYRIELPGKLAAFSNFLGANEWFAGANMSYVDFLAYELFDQHKEFAPDAFENKKIKNLVDFMDRVEVIPNVAKYMRSDRFIKSPIFGNKSNFVGKNFFCQYFETI